MYRVINLLLIGFSYILLSCNNNIEPTSINLELESSVKYQVAVGNAQIQLIENEAMLRHIMPKYNKQGFLDLSSLSSTKLGVKSLKDKSNSKTLSLSFSNLSWDAELSNFTQDNSKTISYDVTYSDTQETHRQTFTSDNNLNLNSFINEIIGYSGSMVFDGGFSSDFTISEKDGGVIIGVAILVGAVVYAHCSDVVERGTKNCKSGCYTASFCSVECHSCEDK